MSVFLSFHIPCGEMVGSASIFGLMNISAKEGWLSEQKLANCLWLGFLHVLKNGNL
jgi:hypothetical protein